VVAAKATDYFAGAVSEPWLTPWVEDGRHIALDPQTWSRVPVQSVSPHGMYATQNRILKKHLDRLRKGGQPEGGDLPWVVHYKGQHWVLDGHHRVALAVEQGAPSIRAHVMELSHVGRRQAMTAPPVRQKDLHGLIAWIVDTFPEHIEDGISRLGFWNKEENGANCPIVVGSPGFWSRVPVVKVSLVAQPINACQYHLTRSHLITSLVNLHASDYEPGAYKNPLMAITGGELWCRDGHHRVTADMLLYQIGLGSDFVIAHVYDMDAVARAAGV
jgi:hypothetical protein